MNDLEQLVPPRKLADDILAAVGGMALDAIPFVGPSAGRALDALLAARDAERRRAFDLAIVGELARLSEKFGLTMADVVLSDEFVATLARVQREAAETASEMKRSRLAAAAAQAGPWSDFAASDRAAFLRLVAKYDELHIWLLAYFCGPADWLDKHGLSHVHEDVNIAEIGSHLAEALQVGLHGERDSSDIPHAVSDALDELIGDQVMGFFRLDTIRDSPFSAQTVARGRRFLAYLRETKPEAINVPSDV